MKSNTKSKYINNSFQNIFELIKSYEKQQIFKLGFKVEYKDKNKSNNVINRRLL